MAANIAEAWRKRYYKPHFLSKISDAEGEAAEAQVWALLARRCEYVTQPEYHRIRDRYEVILKQLVTMTRDAAKWTYDRRPKKPV